MIRKAIKQNSKVAAAHGNLGNALLNLGRPEEALSSYDRALALQPDLVGSHYGRGNALLDLNRPEEALASYDKTIAFNPDFAEAYFNRGKTLVELGRCDEALASYDKVIALKPDYAGAHNNRGNVLRGLKHPAAALESYDKLIALKPDYANAHNNRGNVLRDLKRSVDALESFDKAIALKPTHAEAHSNRGNVLRDLRRATEALTSCDKAIALKPGYAGAYNNRGLALRDLNRPEDALASYDRAIALKPDYAEAYNNRGIALLDLKRPEDALASHDKAIALRPDYAEAYLNKSICLLLMGRFEQGFRQYEWRNKRDEPHSSVRSYPQPLWHGEENIMGKTLFIYWEQGLGDTIQFCRYAKLVEACGANVVLSVQKPLYELLKQISPTIQVIGPNEVPPYFDCHCPLLSLPFAFRTTLETIPAEPQYIKPDEDLRAAWSARLPTKTKPRIGIVWSGGATYEADRRRSMDLETLLPILSADADWLCLQKEIREHDLAVLRQLGRVTYFGDDLGDFSNTAALLDLMDLVISVDTNIAHLAGAMGKPVWILLSYTPHWVWLLDQGNSPWYLSARLFRQQRIGNWSEAIEKVKNELRSTVL